MQLTAKYSRKINLMPRKPKKNTTVPVEQVEHVLQFPLMDNCFLSLQLNPVAGTRWSVGFPDDEVVYPISDAVANGLLHLADSDVPGGWQRRVLSQDEYQFLKEQAEGVCPLAAEGRCVDPVDSVAADNFLIAMTNVWNTQQTQIISTVRSLNSLLNDRDMPLMEATLALVMTTLLGAGQMNVSASYIANMILKFNDCLGSLDKSLLQPVVREAN